MPETVSFNAILTKSALILVLPVSPLCRSFSFTSPAGNIRFNGAGASVNWGSRGRHSYNASKRRNGLAIWRHWRHITPKRKKMPLLYPPPDTGICLRLNTEARKEGNYLWFDVLLIWNKRSCHFCDIRVWQKKRPGLELWSLSVTIWDLIDFEGLNSDFEGLSMNF